MSSLSDSNRPVFTEEQLLKWQQLLEERAGICFSKHQSIIRKGIVARMNELGIDDYDAYYSQISSTPLATVEWHKLLDHMVVKETSFFRDPYSYDLAEQFLSERINGLIGGDEASSIDIWSVGCSTGEEAYSLAMLADHLIAESGKDVYLGVTGIDISEDALNRARLGEYKPQQLIRSPKFLNEKYFHSTITEKMKVDAELAAKMCFTRGNIIKLSSAPKIKMDIIFCQNVLIYFRRERQLEVMDILIECLKPGGILVIGAGEIGSYLHPKVERSTAANVQAYIRK